VGGGLQSGSSLSLECALGDIKVDERVMSKLALKKWDFMV